MVAARATAGSRDTRSCSEQQGEDALPSGCVPQRHKNPGRESAGSHSDPKASPCAPLCSTGSAFLFLSLSFPKGRRQCHKGKAGGCPMCPQLLGTQVLKFSRQRSLAFRAHHRPSPPWVSGQPAPLRAPQASCSQRTWRPARLWFLSNPASFPARISRACGGIRGRLTANRPLPACPAASPGRAALPGPKAFRCPFLSRFPKTKIRPRHLMKDLVWFIYGERQGYKGQVLWAVARLLHRP